MEHQICSVQLMDYIAMSHDCIVGPTWPLITRRAYSTLEHVYHQKPSNSRARSTFSHSASCCKR